jgi:hypothetical protein
MTQGRKQAYQPLGALCRGDCERSQATGRKQIRIAGGPSQIRGKSDWTELKLLELRMGKKEHSESEKNRYWNKSEVV